MGKIDMINFCVHSSCPYRSEKDLCGADFRFLNKLKDDGRYIFKKVKIPVGVWANPGGQSFGTNITCKS